MTNPTKRIEKIQTVALAALVVMLLISIAWLLDAPERNLLAKVQSGELTLQCQFKDGWRVVEPAKVKDFYGNTWIFTNGSATRCEIGANK